MEIIAEATAYAILCFILAPKGSPIPFRLKKGAGGAILFVALFLSYTILQPLLPTEIDHLLHSTIWGVLFAYAVPTEHHPKKKSNKEQGDDEDDKKHTCPKVGVEEGTPPTFTLK
jgi:hypothetical protein